jgi:hypothetical protein
MSDIGNYAEQMFLFILSREPRTWGKTVQGILSLKKEYSNEIINQACKRAVAFNVCGYRVIKNICFNGSYNLPIDLPYLIEDNTYEYN